MASYFELSNPVHRRKRRTDAGGSRRPRRAEPERPIEPGRTNRGRVGAQTPGKHPGGPASLKLSDVGYQRPAPCPQPHGEYSCPRACGRGVPVPLASRVHEQPLDTVGRASRRPAGGPAPGRRTHRPAADRAGAPPEVDRELTPEERAAAEEYAQQLDAAPRAAPRRPGRPRRRPAGAAVLRAGRAAPVPARAPPRRRPHRHRRAGRRGGAPRAPPRRGRAGAAPGPQPAPARVRRGVSPVGCGGVGRLPAARLVPHTARVPGPT